MTAPPPSVWTGQVPNLQCCGPVGSSTLRSGDKETYRDSVLEMLLSVMRIVEAQQQAQHRQLVEMLEGVSHTVAEHSTRPPCAEGVMSHGLDVGVRSEPGGAAFGGTLKLKSETDGGEEKLAFKVDPDQNALQTESMQASTPHHLHVGGVEISSSARVIVKESRHFVRVPDVTDGLLPWLEAVSFNVIRNPRFDYYIGLVIMANSLCIGYETARDVEGGEIPPVVNWAEHAFMCIYIVEISMRFFCDGRKNFGNRWVVFDLLMVGMGAVSIWVLRPASSFAEENFYEGKDSEWLASVETLMIARILRLLRLLRALRGLRQFRTLYTLAQGLLNSLGTMLSTLGLLLFTIFAFACLGCEAITRNEYLILSEDEDVQYVLATHFSSLQEIMLTLTQFIFADSIGSIYVPLIKARWVLFLYFVPILLILPISMMNLVTAVLVDSARALSEDDDEFALKERQKKIRKLIPMIQSSFRNIDTDCNGVLTRSEVRLAANSLPPLVKEIMNQERPLEFFETIDVDGDRLVEEEEFVEGILHMAIKDVSLETQQTLKILRTLKHQMKTIETGLIDIHSNQHFQKRQLSECDLS